MRGRGAWGWSVDDATEVESSGVAYLFLLPSGKLSSNKVLSTKPSAETECTRALVLDFPAFRAVSKKLLLFLSYLA